MSAKKRKKQQYQNGDKGIISQVFEETVRQARKFPKDKNYFPCIPVRYFKYASAEKCARQLAEYDLEISR